MEVLRCGTIKSTKVNTQTFGTCCGTDENLSDERMVGTLQNIFSKDSN